MIIYTKDKNRNVTTTNTTKKNKPQLLKKIQFISNHA